MKIFLLESLDTNAVIGLSLVFTVVMLAIWHAIIQSATRSKAIERELKMQSEVLKEMALKQGVTAETINAIIERYNKLV